MWLELHDRLTAPLRIPATRVVVYDEHQNPVAFLLQLGPGHLRICRVGEPEFDELRRLHGIQQTVVVTQHDLAKLPPLPVRGK